MRESTFTNAICKAESKQISKDFAYCENAVSRQAAIDAIKSRKTAEQSSAGIMRNAVVDFCIDIVKKLPSAQPERLTDYSFEESCTECPAYDTENHRCPRFNQVIRMALKDANLETCEDTISRQAAIDVVNSIDNLDAKARGGICINLMGLPSAQPERTCVNCGRTVNNGGWYADGRTRCPIEEHYALPKDGFCHLWEKRNVTDDDYPERREDERPES